jgi:hypothetical protein
MRKREPAIASASPSTTINRAWIVSELIKIIDSEHALAAGAKTRAESPPDPSLSVLYYEIAAADARHVAILETVATRYGHTPTRSEAVGVGERLGRIKDKVAELGTSAVDLLSQDLTAKADAIHWRTAWLRAFEATGEVESARDLLTVLTEDQAHRDALQEALNRMVEQGARGEDEKS